MKCACCGKKEMLPFQCSHCGSYFCADHRLPENHNCPLGGWQRKVRLPNGGIVKFDKKRITRTIFNKVKMWAKAEELSNEVINVLNEKYPERILELKDIRNVVNEVLNKYHGEKCSVETSPPRWEPHKRRHTRIIASVICLGICIGGILILKNKVGLPSLANDLSWRGENGESIWCGENGENIWCGENGENIWCGENGESMDEFVTVLEAIVVGADGDEIRLHNNPKAVNPTFKELLAFLARDETDQIPYNSNKFVCADYAEMLHNNAENAGIRAAYVSVQFYLELSYNHALNAFRTVDNGLVFIDMSGECDCVAHMKIDRHYQITSLFSDVQFFPMGKVLDYEVQW